MSNTDATARPEAPERSHVMDYIKISPELKEEIDKAKQQQSDENNEE